MDNVTTTTFENVSTTGLPTTTNIFQQKQCILGFPEKLQLILYVLVIIFGVVGNSSICYCFGLFHKSSRKTVSEVLILYLAVVDFCASIFTPFFFIYWIVTCNSEWHFGTFGCKLIPFLGRVFINISVGIICILAFDRYRAICSPFKGQFRKKHIHIFVLVAILLAVLCEIYYLDALTYHKTPLPRGNKGCLVTPDNKLQYIEITSSLLLARDAFFVLMFTYTSVRIVVNLKKRNVYVTSQVCGNSSDKKNRREMEHVIRVIIVMQIVFIVLVLPRDLLHIIFTLSWIDNDGIPYSKEVIRLNDALKVIQTANSCANVFIYAKMHDRFRKNALDLLQFSVSCGKTPRPNINDNVESSDNTYENNNENNNKQYSRCLLKNAKPLRGGSFVTGDTIVSQVEPSPALIHQKKHFLLVEYEK